MIPNGSIAVSSRRVLLIENSPADRHLLRSWLNSEMIETFEATDAVSALSCCQRVQPNLILLQLRLNTWDGFEVIRRLKDDPKTRSIPVIIVASSALTAEKAKGIDMGAVDFVSKPFDSVELLARVNSALRTKALLDLLEQRAHLDGLTELGNRFALQEAMPRELNACRNDDRPFSVVMADLDHFKRINDRFGHAAGDEVLRRMALVFRSLTRPTDFLGRYGGEEFVALCPDCTQESALKIAEEIRREVANTPVAFRESLIPMSASLGVVSVDPAAFPDHPSSLLEWADLALYRAKASGRDAVYYWDTVLEEAVASTLGSRLPRGEVVAQAAGSSPCESTF